MSALIPARMPFSAKECLVQTLALGVYADEFAIAMDNAVVSCLCAFGEHVDRDALLAEVGNKRVDNQGLVDLRAHLSRARSA
jgi:hypothetical protein